MVRLDAIMNGALITELEDCIRRDNERRDETTSGRDNERRDETTSGRDNERRDETTSGDFEFSDTINAVAGDSSLDPAERIKQLRALSDKTKDVWLLGQVQGYIGSLELQREARAMEQGLGRIVLRENAGIRENLIGAGQATADELDRAGYLSHDELDSREADEAAGQGEGGKK